MFTQHPSMGFDTVPKYRATLEQGHELREVLTNTVDIDPPSASTSNAASNTGTSTSNVASNTYAHPMLHLAESLEHGLLKGNTCEARMNSTSRDEAPPLSLSTSGGHYLGATPSVRAAAAST